MAKELIVLPTDKGYESRFGNYTITVTPEIIEQLKQGKVLHINIEEYSVVLKLGTKVGYDLTFRENDFDPILPPLIKFGLSCSENIKRRLSSLICDIELSYYGSAVEKLAILQEVRELAKDNKEVLNAIDCILEKFSAIK